MKSIKQLLAGIAIAVTAFSANANTYSLAVDGTPQGFSVVGAFTDYLTFNNPLPGSFSYTVSNIPGSQVVNFGMFNLTLTTDITGLTYSFHSGMPSTGPVVATGPVSAGDYYIQVSGTGSGTSGLGNYGVVATMVPVPEPGEWALMLSGFGLIALMIRRRSANAS